MATYPLLNNFKNPFICMFLHKSGDYEYEKKIL